MAKPFTEKNPEKQAIEKQIAKEQKDKEVTKDKHDKHEKSEKEKSEKDQKDKDQKDTKDKEQKDNKDQKEQKETKETKDTKDQKDKDNKHEKQEKEKHEKEIKDQKEHKESLKDHKESAKEKDLHKELESLPMTAMQPATTDPAAAAAEPALFKVSADKLLEKSPFEKFHFEKTHKDHDKAFKDKDKDIFEIGTFTQTGDPELTQRVAAIEGVMSQLMHFIPAEMRPDLATGALSQEADAKKATEPAAQPASQPTDAPPEKGKK